MVHVTSSMEVLPPKGEKDSKSRGEKAKLESCGEFCKCGLNDARGEESGRS